MDYPKLIESNQKEGPIGIQMVKGICCTNKLEGKNWNCYNFQDINPPVWVIVNVNEGAFLLYGLTAGAGLGGFLDTKPYVSYFCVSVVDTQRTAIANVNKMVIP